MKKLDWNTRYNTIAVYSFLVAAAVLVFAAFVFKFPVVWQFVKTLGTYLKPFVYGFCFAYLLSPLVKFYEKYVSRTPRFSRKASRGVSIALAYLSVAGLTALFLLVVIPSLVESVSQIVRNISYYSEQVNLLLDELVQVIPSESISQQLTESISSLVDSFGVFLAGAVLQIVSITTWVTSGVLDLVMGIIISLYMLASKETLIAQVKQILYALLPARNVRDLIALAHDSNAKFSGFILGKIVDSFIIGCLCALGMTIFRMPFIALVSLTVGVTNVIPYFGPFIGAIPGILLVFIGGGPWQALGFAVFILVLQQFDGNILGPAILGQSTGLDAMWVIFAILLFGGLYGFVGMVIGVPLLAVLAGLFKAFISGRLRKKDLPVEIQHYTSEEHRLL